MTEKMNHPKNTPISGKKIGIPELGGIVSAPDKSEQFDGFRGEV
jgi:hypothetical protein